MKDQELWDHLHAEVGKKGMAVVRATCSAFLMKKTHLAEGEQTKRKPIPRAWTLAALDKQRGHCPRCPDPLDTTDVVGDHIAPLAAGGKHVRWNIAAMHRRCNSAKGARNLAEDAKHSGTSVLEFLDRATGKEKAVTVAGVIGEVRA